MQDVANATMHLKEHISYPATKAQLVAACNNMSDFSDEDKKSFAETLSDRTYNSADEVIQALGLQPGASAQI